jgi:outer membrane protein assembly factor BamB
MRRRSTLAAAVFLALIGVLAVVAVRAPADTITGAANALRTGWYGNQPALSPAAVRRTRFRRLFSTSIQGKVYAQPLVSSNTLLVVTESNDAYGLDPATGAIRWHRNFGVPWNPDDIQCTDLMPTIGITSTPTIDPATHTAYFTSKTYASGSGGPGEYVAHAVDVRTGAERPHWPIVIGGTPTNAPDVTFDATSQLQRPGLLFMHGVIYAAFGSLCDFNDYRGYIVGINTRGAQPTQTTMWATQDSTQAGGGIWMSGSPLMSDGPGQILFATGNTGVIPDPGTPGLGSTPSLGLSDSLVRLSVQPNGSLSATDFFSPVDSSQDALDADFGSGGVVGLPDSFGTRRHRHLLVVADKAGYVYLLDRNNLGGRGTTTDTSLARVGPYGGVWSKPAVWPGDGGYIWQPSAQPVVPPVIGDGGVGNMRVYHRVLDRAGNPSLRLVATSRDGFGFGSSAPIVTSSGTRSGTALVWVVRTDNVDNTSATVGELRAYDAVPRRGALHLRFSAPIGIANKFTPPVADGGRVYVGTADGHVMAFGLPVVNLRVALHCPSSAYSGGTFACVATIRNAGPYASAQTTITLREPGRARHQPQVLCVLRRLAVGHTARCRAGFRASAIGRDPIIATVSTVDNDPVLADNTRIATVRVH